MSQQLVVLIGLSLIVVTVLLIIIFILYSNRGKNIKDLTRKLIEAKLQESCPQLTYEIIYHLSIDYRRSGGSAANFVAMIYQKLKEQVNQIKSFNGICVLCEGFKRKEVDAILESVHKYLFVDEDGLKDKILEIVSEEWKKIEESEQNWNNKKIQEFVQLVKQEQFTDLDLWPRFYAQVQKLKAKLEQTSSVPA